jgi:hypothetical protein
MCACDPCTAAAPADQLLSARTPSCLCIPPHLPSHPHLQSLSFGRRITTRVAYTPALAQLHNPATHWKTSLTPGTVTRILHTKRERADMKSDVKTTRYTRKRHVLPIAARANTQCARCVGRRVKKRLARGAIPPGVTRCGRAWCAGGRHWATTGWSLREVHNRR